MLIKSKKETKKKRNTDPVSLPMSGFELESLFRFAESLDRATSVLERERMFHISTYGIAAMHHATSQLRATIQRKKKGQGR